MDSQALLSEISDYCRRMGLAESTFGRLAVNDGKLMNRLRYGGRVTVETVQRVHDFMKSHALDHAGRGASAGTLLASQFIETAPRVAESVPITGQERNFRFFDNRQKYLLFVNTCSEKWAVANRVVDELVNIRPRPPALRLFDAGVGDGTVLSRVMRAMHSRYPTMPFYIVGKEISLEDVRLALEKMPDRFHEHPATVLVMTNLYYAEAPWFAPNSVDAASRIVWKDIALTGTTAFEFDQQIADLQPFLSDNWRAKISPRSGNPIYEKPVVLVIYREDYRFLLDSIRPRRGTADADFDLVIASQPYRARASVEFKASKVIGPLARALGPGGRLVGIHSRGNDPGLEIAQRIWPGENPFTTDRNDLLRATKTELGGDARHYNFKSGSDERSLFRYDMHTLPNEISSAIGTSTLLAAWNAAIYVNQIEDHRLTEVMQSDVYLEACREVLAKYGALWFWDESYIISRRQDPR